MQATLLKKIFCSIYPVGLKRMYARVQRVLPSLSCAMLLAPRVSLTWGVGTPLLLTLIGISYYRPFQRTDQISGGVQCGHMCVDNGLLPDMSQEWVLSSCTLTLTAVVRPRNWAVPLWCVRRRETSLPWNSYLLALWHFQLGDYRSKSVNIR